MITTARHPASASSGHEPDTVRTRAILWFALILTLTVVLSQAAVYGFHRVLAHRYPGEAANQPQDVADFASADHWLVPREDLARLRAREDQNLNSFGWLDESHTKAHIPIDQAMKLYADRVYSAVPNLQTK
jgi:hypothetical protein